MTASSTRIDPSEPAPRWARALTITVDGGAGTGKSTIARGVAERMGYTYIDTGAMYRAVGWLALERGIDLDDADALERLARENEVLLPYRNDRWEVEIAGRDVTDAIREPRVDEAASKVARHQPVRTVMIERQRAMSEARDSVLDGRDCGTIVRPDADLKFAITARPEERARRRAAQQGLNKRQTKAVAQSLAERDARDASQSAIARDAIEIDTSDVTVEQVLDDLVGRWLARRASLLDEEEVAGKTAREWIDVPDLERAVRRWRRRTLWLWRGAFRYDAHGIERVPDRNCIFVANHLSMWDPAFLIGPLNRPIRYMAKVEAMNLPVYGTIGKQVGAFPVRRGAGDRVSLHVAENVLRRGESLGIFPEGTRIYSDALARPRHGAARLALVTGVPIVPVALYGIKAETAYKVKVAFGTPHEVGDRRATPGNVSSLMDAVWDDVEELWSALRNDMTIGRTRE